MTRYEFNPTKEALTRTDEISAVSFALQCIGEAMGKYPLMADSLAASAVHIQRMQLELHEFRTAALLSDRAAREIIEISEAA